MKSESEIREFYEAELKADLEVADALRRKPMPIVYSMHALEMVIGLWVLHRVGLLVFGSWPPGLGNLWSPDTHIGFMGIVGAGILHALLCRVIHRRDRGSQALLLSAAFVLVLPSLMSQLFMGALLGMSMMGLIMIAFTLKQSLLGWRMLAATAGLLCLGMVGGVVQFQPFGHNPGEQWLPVGAAVICAGLVRAVVVSHLMSKANVDFKENIVRKIVGFIDEGFEYRPDRYVHQGYFLGSKLFPAKTNTFGGEDLVEGTTCTPPVMFSELHAQRVNQGSRRRRYTTVFRGVFLLADFNKNFKSETLVIPDMGWGPLAFLRRKRRGKEYEKTAVELESPDFERRFDVFGDDQVEARYILTPDLMERLVDFREKAGRAVYVSFVQSTLCLAIPLRFNEDLFEMSVYRSNVRFDFIKEYVDMINLLVGIVGILDLNTRIWTKE